VSEEQISKLLLEECEDRYFIQPNLSVGVPDTLLGYLLNLAEDMPVLAADLSACCLVVS